VFRVCNNDGNHTVDKVSILTYYYDVSKHKIKCFTLISNFSAAIAQSVQRSATAQRPEFDFQQGQ
jgi:hypothetical protein